MPIDQTYPVARAVRAAIVLGTLSSAGMQAAIAQEEVKLEEVTVSATRGASDTNLQRTPVSVSAVTAADIDRLVLARFAQGDQAADQVGDEAE